MGLFTGLLKVHLLQKLLSGLTRGSQTGRPGGFLSKPLGRVALTGIAAMFIRRAMRRMR